MDSDNLFEAMKMFQSGVKEYAFTNAINQANDAVRQIKESSLKDNEKNSQLQQIANQMVGYMATQGLSATTIQQISQSLAPPRAASLVDALRSGDTATVSAYTEADKIQRAGEIEQLKEKAKIDASSQFRLFEQQQTLSQMKSETQTAKPDQFKAGVFGKRAFEADEVMNTLTQKGFNRASAATSASSLLPNRLQGASLQKQSQAERNFVNAVLRRESGAAISKSEFDSAEQQYFPRSGDSDEVLQQKRQNRETVMQGLLSEAGSAVPKIFTKGIPSRVQNLLGQQQTEAVSDTPDWMAFTKKR